MSATKHREAAHDAALAARRRSAERPNGTTSQMIGRRMLLDISEAAMVGFGELLDFHGDVGVSGEITLRAFAGAVASLTLTMANGDEAKALGVLPVVFDELRRVAEERIGADPSNRTSADVSRDDAGGPA